MSVHSDMSTHKGHTQHVFIKSWMSYKICQSDLGRRLHPVPGEVLE